MQSSVMKILSDNNLCVLCTCSDNIPNSSLMLYICDINCTKMYILTLRDSTKYQNIINNPNVSLLIDTRDRIQDTTSQIEALTIQGEASVVEDTDVAEKLIEQLIKKHDKLLNLSLCKNVCVVEITMKSVLFLESVDKNRYIDLQGN